ncbi:MAG: hypothetical protein Tsb0020_28860 [Haliangiales bacterium]
MTSLPSQRGLALVATAAVVAVVICAATLAIGACDREAPGVDDFRVLPYLQNPAADAVTVRWFTRKGSPGALSVRRVGGERSRHLRSQPQATPALVDSLGEIPYRHHLRVRGLVPDTRYEYTVTQGESRVRGRFRTPPRLPSAALSGTDEALPNPRSAAPQSAAARSRRAPLATMNPIRIIALADCETEPQSTGKATGWPDPRGRVPGRRYLVDQTQGVAMNLDAVRARAPDLVLLAGDLVEAGGDPQDWDEFWGHFGLGRGALAVRDQAPSAPAAAQLPTSRLAARFGLDTLLGSRDGAASGEYGPGVTALAPLVAVPGNHEYFAGPKRGGYELPASEAAIARFWSYFEPTELTPPSPPDASSSTASSSPSPERAAAGDATATEPPARYVYVEYGPVTIIGLDVANNSPHRSAHDTNFYLRGQDDPGGGSAPSFGPGSRQYAWLDAALRRAQARPGFTIVMLHHVPYSVGPHGWPAGAGDPAAPAAMPAQVPPSGRTDPQSGVPVRALTPLLIERGVDVVIAGHDEIFERSQLFGRERHPSAGERPHQLHVYDVGVCGDGLRSPQLGLENPYQRYLAQRDDPETWRGDVLVSGGAHYGHLEIDIRQRGHGFEAELEPVYILPQPSTYLPPARSPLAAARAPSSDPAEHTPRAADYAYKRRVYRDVITLHAGHDAVTPRTEHEAITPRAGE